VVLCPAGPLHPGWVSALVLTATGSMERFSPRHISLVLWACAQLRHYEPRLLSAVRVQALASMQGFEPSGLSVLAWALARLRVQDKQLLGASRQQRVHGRCASGFGMQGLANLAWATTSMSQQLTANNARSRSSTPALPRGRALLLRNPTPAAAQRHRAQQQPQERQQLQGPVCCSSCSAAVLLLCRYCPRAKPQGRSANLLWAVCHRPSCIMRAVPWAGLPCCTAGGSSRDRCSPGPGPGSVGAGGALEVARRRSPQQLLAARAGLNSLHLFGPHQAEPTACWAVAASEPVGPSRAPAGGQPAGGGAAATVQPPGVATTLWALTKMGGAFTTAAARRQRAHPGPTSLLSQCPRTSATLSMACCKAQHRSSRCCWGAWPGAASNAAAATFASYSLTSSSSSTWQPACRPLRSHQQRALQLAALLMPSSSARVAAAVLRAQQAQQLNRQGVCSLVWAFSGLGWSDPTLLQQLQQLSVCAIRGRKMSKASHVTAESVPGAALDWGSQVTSSCWMHCSRTRTVAMAAGSPTH